MKKLLSSAIVLSLAFLFQSAFGLDLYYPTASPHLINKGNMASNPANPYIGTQKMVSFYYGTLSLYESSYLDDFKGDAVSLSGDLPLGERISLFGEESVLSLGYFDSKSKLEYFGKEHDANHSTMALQLSSKYGERLKGSVRLRMESAEHHGKTADYTEFDLGFNYTLENHCEVGLHISPKGDSDSKDTLQAGVGCLMSPRLSVGADLSRISEGDEDTENGLVLSAEYLLSQDVDLEVILNFFENERNLEFSFYYMLETFLLRASFVTLNERDVDDNTSTIQGLLMGVSGSF